MKEYLKRLFTQKTVKEVIDGDPTIIGPQTIRLERARWKKRYAVGTIVLTGGTIFLAKKIHALWLRK